MPMVKDGRIKISVIGPDQGVNLGVETDLIEKIEVVQRAVIMAVQHRFKVDDPLLAVFKNDPHGVGGNDFEVSYINQKMVHYAINSFFVLVINVNMGLMMSLPNLSKYANDDAIESG